MQPCRQTGNRCAARLALCAVRPGLWRLEPLGQPQEVASDLSVNSNIFIFYVASLWEVWGSTHLSAVLFCPHGPIPRHCGQVHLHGVQLSAACLQNGHQDSARWESC